MNTDTPGAFADLARELISGLRGGWTADQATWGETSLAEVVLPSVWDHERPDQEQVDELVAMTSGLSTVDAAERWADLVTAHYVSLLRPLQMSAILLATQAYDADADDRGWLAIEAEGVLAMMDALADEMRRHSPATLELLQDEVDATMVDCDYVRTGRAMSDHLRTALAARLPGGAEPR